MTNALARVPSPAMVPQPSRVGQATAIEQNRATAEVYAAVMVAQQMPRNEQAAIRKMHESTANPALAERAFWRFPRGRETLTGSTIQLARELARCWGNIQHNVGELRRDDLAHESEMIAWAWDLETNTRSSVTFVVPHVRDTKTGRQNLVEVRDVYENNANMGARRLRECIFAVLPGWYVAEAEERCVNTLKAGAAATGKTLAQRAADAIESFVRFNVVASQLEDKVGRGSGEWTDMDLVTLQQVWRALNRGETTKDEEFPPARVTGADIEAQAIAAAQANAARIQAEALAAAAQAEADAAAEPAPAVPGAGDRPAETPAPEPAPAPGPSAVDKPVGGPGPAIAPGSDEARKAEREAAFQAEQTRRRNARKPAAPTPEQEPDPRDEEDWPATPPIPGTEGISGDA